MRFIIIKADSIGGMCVAMSQIAQINILLCTLDIIVFWRSDLDNFIELYRDNFVAGDT